jgi:transcriptional regulator with XRE-family HTH domain
VRRHQLADTLRLLRLEAKCSVIDAAHALRCSRPKIQHLESGRNLPSYPDLDSLLRRYGRPDLLDELDEIRVAAEERGWWSTYRLPPWLQAYVGLETDACAVRCFALELVPGLLQTPEYARYTLERWGSSAAEVERGVRVRVERQRRLYVDLRLTVVMSEALLWRTLHMGCAGAGQLEHMTSLAAGCGGVELYVVPFAAGGHRSMSGSFTLMAFPGGAWGPVAYQEYAVGGHLVDEDGAVVKLDGLLTELRGQALDPAASASLISDFATRAKG